MLSQEGGHIGRVTKDVDSTLCAIHMNGDSIHSYFGRRRDVGDNRPEGVPTEFGAGGNLGNHKNALKNGERCFIKRRRTWPWVGISCFQ